MAKKKKDSRRASLKSFASKSPAYPGRMQSEKAELVYGGEDGNYGAGVGKTFVNLDMGATAADNAGYGYIYMNGTLYTTDAGRAKTAKGIAYAKTNLPATTNSPLQ